MRTNPFFDAWLFIIGSTDDHQKLGAAKFLLVALFLVLVAVSLWIAWTNWREDPGQRSGAHITTCVCRVLIGCMWFQGCLWKLPLPISDGFQYWTGEMAENAAFAFHRALVTSVYLPYLSFIQPAVAQAGVGTGFRKTSCSIRKLEREDDSKMKSSCSRLSGRSIGYCRRLTEANTKVAGAGPLFSTQCNFAPNSAKACPARTSSV